MVGGIEQPGLDPRHSGSPFPPRGAYHAGRPRAYGAGRTRNSPPLCHLPPSSEQLPTRPRPLPGSHPIPTPAGGLANGGTPRRGVGPVPRPLCDSGEDKGATEVARVGQTSSLGGAESWSPAAWRRCGVSSSAPWYWYRPGSPGGAPQPPGPPSALLLPHTVDRQPPIPSPASALSPEPSRSEPPSVPGDDVNPGGEEQRPRAQLLPVPSQQQHGPGKCPCLGGVPHRLPPAGGRTWPLKKYPLAP